MAIPIGSICCCGGAKFRTVRYLRYVPGYAPLQKSGPATLYTGSGIPTQPITDPLTGSQIIVAQSSYLTRYLKALLNTTNPGSYQYYWDPTKAYSYTSSQPGDPGINGAAAGSNRAQGPLFYAVLPTFAYTREGPAGTAWNLTELIIPGNVESEYIDYMLQLSDPVDLQAFGNGVLVDMAAYNLAQLPWNSGTGFRYLDGSYGLISTYQGITGYAALAPPYTGAIVPDTAVPSAYQAIPINTAGIFKFALQASGWYYANPLVVNGNLLLSTFHSQARLTGGYSIYQFPVLQFTYGYDLSTGPATLIAQGNATNNQVVDIPVPAMIDIEAASQIFSPLFPPAEFGSQNGYQCGLMNILVPDGTVAVFPPDFY